MCLDLTKNRSTIALAGLNQRFPCVSARAATIQSRRHPVPARSRMADDESVSLLPSPERHQALPVFPPPDMTARGFAAVHTGQFISYFESIPDSPGHCKHISPTFPANCRSLFHGREARRSRRSSRWNRRRRGSRKPCGVLHQRLFDGAAAAGEPGWTQALSHPPVSCGTALEPV